MFPSRSDPGSRRFVSGVPGLRTNKLILFSPRTVCQTEAFLFWVIVWLRHRMPLGPGGDQEIGSTSGPMVRYLTPLSVLWISRMRFFKSASRLTKSIEDVFTTSKGVSLYWKKKFA